MSDDPPTTSSGGDLEAEARVPTHGPPWKRALRGLLPLAVLALGVGLVVYLISSAPEPEQQLPTAASAAVEVVTATLYQVGPVVEAYGTVRAARTVTLVPEVEGVVSWVSPALVPGGRFRRGDEVLRIDPTELQLAVAGAEAEIAEAELMLSRELAEQRVRERTRELFPEDQLVSEEGRELSRWEPQVERARRTLRAAQARLERARLDLERTAVLSPCECVVEEAPVALGARISPQQPIAMLVELDVYHVEVSVPVEVLGGIAVTGSESSPATVTMELHGEPHVWAGHVARLAPNLTEQGSMAQLVVEVPDPWGLDEPVRPREVPLLLDAFVQVRIAAEPIPGAVAIPRAGLREGEQVWIADAREQLEAREVAIAWRMEDTVLVTEGVAPGERVIVSRLSAPVEGMELSASLADDELRLASGEVGGGRG